MRAIDVTTGLVEGAVSFEHGDGWIKPWRIPFELRTLFYPEEGLMLKGEQTAGVRLRFLTDADSVALVVAPDEGERRFDLTRGADLLASEPLPAGEDTVTFGGLSGQAETYQLWLPQAAGVRLRSLLVPDGATLRSAPDDRPRWVTYGSSITQCGGAHSPARAWPAIAARLRGLNLTCLGFGGNCHFEPMVATVIRDLRADLITLKLGINVQGASSLSPRTYQPAVIGLVRIIREGHPGVPIGVVTPIISPPRETTPNAVGMSLGDCRRHDEEAVRRLRECGDERLELFSGLDLLGRDDVQHLPDGLHPNGDGYELIGRRFAELVLPTLLNRLAL